jgi:antitoxin MazE
MSPPPMSGFDSDPKSIYNVSILLWREAAVRTEFRKWGNSLALRVPSAFAKEIGAAEGQAVDMTIENGALVVKVTTPKRRHYSLEQLIGEVTEENRHSETSWGPPVGNEVW